MKSFRCLLIICLFISVSPLHALYGIEGDIRAPSGGLLRCLAVSFVLYAVGTSESSHGVDQVKGGEVDFISEVVEESAEVISVADSNILYSGCDFSGAPLFCEKWRKDIEEMLLWEEMYDEISGSFVTMSATESKAVGDKVLSIEDVYGDDLNMHNMSLLSKEPRRRQMVTEEGEDYKEVHKRALARFERAMIPIGIISVLLLCTSALFIFLGMREECEACAKRCSCYKSSSCCRAFVRGCCTDPFTCFCGETFEVEEIITVQRGTTYHISKNGRTRMI